MAVLLLGATGNAGARVARALLQRGDDVVRVLTRDAGILPPGCRVVEGDPGDDDPVVAAATGVDAVFLLTGARPVTYRELAGLLGGGTVEITPADVRTSLLERGMPGWEAEHFQEMRQLFRGRRSEFVTADVEHVLGRDPRTVEGYLQELTVPSATT